MGTAKTTYIHGYTASGECLGTFALTHIDGHVTYGYLAWLSTVGDTCAYLSSMDHCRISADIVSMCGWFHYAGRSHGDNAPDRLIEALNGGTTQSLGSIAPVADKCTCGTSRTPSGGLHNDYCDGFAGQGCRGIVDGSRRCKCCV